MSTHTQTQDRSITPNTNEIPGEHSRENMILSSHYYLRAFRGKRCLTEMVLYFIGVYIINRTLHGRLEIRNFSSRVENISTLEEKFCISARPCNILYIPILASNNKFLPYIEEA